MMKNLLSIIAMLAFLTACQPAGDSAADAAFAKNSATVKAYLKAFQDENVDYSIFADDFISRGTGFGSPDSTNLTQTKENDKNLFASYNFKLVDFDSLVLLPGVNSSTLKPDGSVRYYGNWEVTKPATDSTAAKTGVLKAYESFDFDDNGKLLYQQIYGDFGGLMSYLNSK